MEIAGHERVGSSSVVQTKHARGFEEGSRRAHGSETGCQQGSVASSRSQSRQKQEGEQHERMRTAECNGKPLHIR